MRRYGRAFTRVQPLASSPAREEKFTKVGSFRDLRKKRKREDAAQACPRDLTVMSMSSMRSTPCNAVIHRKRDCGIRCRNECLCTLQTASVRASFR